MENMTYKPHVYEGGDPYICASFHAADRLRVLPILEKMDLRGFRFWCSDGITPGMDADEVIAEHIERCDFFIAFLSRNYLGCLDTVDELNFSRDVNKDYLLIYLEDAALPAGLDMRFMRAESIRAGGESPDSVFAKLMHISGVSRFYGIADEALRPAAEKLFEKLEKLYPEHKVFALDAVAKQRSRELAELYIKAGYPSAERLLQDYGFEQISTADARDLRSSVIYQPGLEPEEIKHRLDFIVSTLSADYPGKVITDSLSKSHHAIHKSLLGLSVWLGYDSAADMLAAYGFTGLRSDAGRAATDYTQILDVLRQRYDGKAKPDRMSKLLADNPDLKAGLKTMTNRAPELFGMPLVRYFRETGLIAPLEKQETPSKTAQKRGALIRRIAALYDGSVADYGSFEDAEQSLAGMILKENSKNQIYISSCTSCSGTVRIPLGVSFIAAEAFAGQSDMTELILPPGLTEIRDDAFADCAGMERIVFSEGLERIGSGAFANCAALDRIALPASVRYIGSEAFAGCDALADVTFGNPRINIQEDAFDGCIFELESMQDEAASPAEYFDLKVDRKNTAKILAYTGDEEVVVIPGMIGGHPITSIEKGCFKDNTDVREIYISDSIPAINGDVFKGCTNLEKVHISNAVSKFTATAFAGCTSLVEVNIPDAMADVPRGLFKDSPLTTVYIGKRVKNLSPDAFCKGEMDIATGLWMRKKAIENLVVDEDNETFSAAGTTLLSRDGKVLIAELGDPVKAVIPEGVEEIGPMAFEKFGSLCEVSFPSTLKRIGEKAFAGTGLIRAEFPVGLESIGTQAFSFCRFLNSVEFYDGLKIISQQAFEGCPIRDVYIPASVEVLGSDSFLSLATYQGTVGQKLRIDSANINLAYDGIALYVKSAEGLTLVKACHTDLRPMPNMPAPEPIDYTVKPGTTVIAPHAFARCTNLSSITLPEGLCSIGDMAFWDCRSLSEIHIPDSCTSISPKAFFGISINMV